MLRFSVSASCLIGGHAVSFTTIRIKDVAFQVLEKENLISAMASGRMKSEL